MPITPPAVHLASRRPRRRTPALVLLAAAAAALAGSIAAPLAAEELRGRIDLVARDGKGKARGSDPTQAVVYFVSAATPPHPPKPPESAYRLVTRNKEFTPHILAVPVGSLVQFPNQDPILHNVFSVSPGNAFDLGIYRTGPPKEKRFEQPGLVRVFCNVHQSMVAYVLVLDTAHYVAPAGDGSFRLTGLPRGPGKLTVWHEQADPWSVELSLPLAEDAPPVAARLVVLRPKLPPHLTKTGDPYYHSDAYR